jgi:hypothetical protein
MDKETHVPKRVTVNGKEKTVYVRTDQTERELDHYRMGFFAGVDPLPLDLFGDKLKEKHLIIVAHYETAKKVIRTRLGLDRRSHKVFTGSTLFISHFEGVRDGYPIFKQFYLLFGYSESTNRRMHEIIFETLMTRNQSENHFWMVIPRTLEAMAAQWGGSLMNLQMFPILNLLETQETAGPVSVANPTTSDAVGGSVIGRVFRYPSYPEEQDEFGAPLPILDDPEEARRQGRDWKKFRRRSYE